MRLILAVFVLVLLLAGGYFMMLVGPHAFDPPLRYAATLRLELSVDEQTYVSSQGALCEVHDQRDSIAVGDYSIKTVFENPYVLLPDGRAIVASGLSPCKWAKAPPVEGRVYRMVDLTDPSESGMSIIRPYAENEVSMSGRLVLIDNIRQPKISRTLALSSTEQLGQLGIRVLAVTIRRDDHPKTRPLEDALPFLATAIAQGKAMHDTSLEVRRQAAIAMSTRTFSASAMKRRDDIACPLENSISPIAGWVEIDNRNTCKGQVIGQVPIRLSSDFRRIEVDSAARAKSVPSIAVFLSGVVPQQVGTFGSGGKFRELNYEWMAQACLDQQCFDFGLGFPGLGYKLFYNRKLDIYVLIASSSGWVQDLEHADY